MSRKIARRWLLGIAVVLMGLVASGIVARAGGSGQRLEGAFIMTGTPDPGGPPPSTVIRLFTRHGGVVGPAASLLGSTVCGEWIRTGKREFAVTYISLNYAPTGPIVGMTKARISINLNKNGDEFTGRFRAEVFDLNGNLVTSFTGSVEGKRIQVELLT